MTENIKQFLEADALRTKTDWHWDEMHGEVKCEFDSCIADLNGYADSTDNGRFIAAASRIAPEIRNLLAAFEQVCEALEALRDDIWDDKVCDAALTAAAPYRKLTGGV